MADCLRKIEEEARQRIRSAPDFPTLEKIRSHYLGKDGVVTVPLRRVKDWPPDQRRDVARSWNSLRVLLEDEFRLRRQLIDDEIVRKNLIDQKIDCTLPRRGGDEGGFHPLSLVMARIRSLWHSAGFCSVVGPEIEDDWHNFTALNTPEHHPARSMHDTFYLLSGGLLRTHTSPLQIRHLRTHQPPLQVIGMGRVYRVDQDATHSPMFHQLEGLCVNETVNFSHLKTLLNLFLRRFFDDSCLKIRFRPSYFPFTEPSAEIDVFFQATGMPAPRWLEVGGCGLIHPNVLSMSGVDTARYRGFAFGLGVERLAMLFYGISDLRLFYQNDIRFLSQFRRRGSS